MSEFTTIATMPAASIGQSDPAITTLSLPNGHKSRYSAVQSGAVFVAGSDNLLDTYAFNGQGRGVPQGMLTVNEGLVVRGLVVKDSRGWVVARRQSESMYKLFTVDVSNLSNPILVSENSLNVTRVSSVAVAGSTLFVQNDSTISMFDLTSSAAPIFAGTLKTVGTPITVFSDGELLFVVSTKSDSIQNGNDGGIEIFSARDANSFNAASRVVVANNVRFGMGLWTDRAVIHNSTLYIAFGEKGAFAIDVSDIAKATLLGQFDTVSPALSVAVTASNDVVVLSDTGHLDMFAGVNRATPP